MSEESQTPEVEEAVPTVSAPEENNSKVSIIGAGAVGSACTYAMKIQGVARHLAMYDIAGDRVRAEAMDIAQGGQFTRESTVDGSDDISVIKDSDIVVVTAGARQQPGQSRLDLAGATINMMKSILPAAVEQAPNAIFLMVSNPVDVVTYAGLKITGMSPDRFFGSGTVLDSSRLRHLVAQECGVSSKTVHAYVVGEHGDSEIPLWSSAMIGAVPLMQWGETHDGKVLDDRMRDEIHHHVVNSAYKIIEGKGATNYAIGLSVSHIVSSILGDERRILPVSSLLDDWLGISDVAMAVPTVVGRDGLGRRLVPLVTPREFEGLRSSANSIREVAAKFGY